MAETTARRTPAPDRRQVGRRVRRHLRDHQPGHRGGRRPGAQRQCGGRRAAAAAAAKEAQPGWAAGRPTSARDLMHAAAGGHPGQVRRTPAAGDRRDRRDRDRRFAHAGAGGRRPLRALRRGTPGRLQTPLPPQAGAGHAARPRRHHRRHGQPPARRGRRVHHVVQLPDGQHGGQGRPALAMGNTVVVKPAPQDPLAIVELVRILDEVGLPARRRQPGNGNDADAAAALVDSPRRRLVSFTGSTQVGVTIAEKAGADDEAAAARAGRQGRLRRLRRRRREGGHRLHRLDLDVPLGPDLHGADPGGRPPQHLRPGVATAWRRWQASSRWATRRTRPRSSAR